MLKQQVKRALKEAKKSDHYHHKHATLLFRGSVLVATGYNQGPKHAEIMALNGVKHKGGAKGLVVVNVRMTKGGAVGMAKPCRKCEEELRKAGVNGVFFTTDIGTVDWQWKVSSYGK